jgi:hypothetical protein
MRFARLSLVLLAGCSTGRYDADYAKAVAAYRDAATFAVLRPVPDVFASSRVMINLPVGFSRVTDGPPVAEGGPPVAADPSRLRPSFLVAFPGYQATHEQRLAADGAELPVAVAVGVLPASAGRAALERTILEQARGDEAFKGGQSAWEDRDVAPRDGGPRAWRVLTLIGPQVFESVVAGNPEYKRWDGRCEIWLSADPQQELITLLAWRAPDKLARELAVPLSQLAETAARTVAIGPADAGPADAGP